MVQFFLRIYDFLLHRKVWRWTLLIVPLLGMLWLGSRIKMEENIAGFLPETEANARLNFVYKNLGITEKILVRFSLKDTLADVGVLMDAADAFAAQLDTLDMVADVRYQVDVSEYMELMRFLTAHAPYFLTEADYARMDSLLARPDFAAWLARDRELLASPAGGVMKDNLLTDPFHLFTPVLERLKGFRLEGHYTLVDDYIFTSDSLHLMMFVTSANGDSETARNAELADAMAAAVASVSPDVAVDYFGAPLVAVGNARQVKADSWMSMVVAIVLMLLLLGGFFRRVRPMLLVILPIAFGGAFGLALMYLLKGTVSVIALGAGAVILGIAVDYSLHYLIHLKRESNPRTALRDIINPMVTGNVTTVGAFLSLLFISAASMRDMGLFAAFALIGTIIFVLVFMPHLVGRGVGEQRGHWLERLAQFAPEKHRWLVWTVVGLTVGLAFFSNDVAFETDFRKINYMTDSQRAAFQALSSHTTLGDKHIYHVSEGKTLDAALRIYERQRTVMDSLLRAGALSGMAGGGDLLPSDSLQRVRLVRWNTFRQRHAADLQAAIAREGVRSGFREGAFVGFDQLLSADFQPQSPDFFMPVRNALLKEFIIESPEKSVLITQLYVEPERLDATYQAFENQSDAFAFDMVSVTQKMIDALSDDFNYVFYICGFLVFFFLWFSFGRLEITLFAFLPMAISWVWILGIMGLFDIHFNIVNIILATFIFGLGDDYTIFILDGLMYEYAYGRKMLASYKTSVALSALTMFIGVGALIFAEHPAMRSLAEVTIIGMLCVVLIAYVLPPLLYRWLVRHHGTYRTLPLTFRSFFYTVYSFIIFLIGSLFITVYGLWLFKIHKRTEARKLKFHILLCGISRFVVRYLPGVKTTVENVAHEKFEKPAIIVCNHQAHLDVMFTLMLNPKIIILTNEWVWNSPFYGRIVRYAGFYPVADGVEKSVDYLRGMMDDGYSIVVFPEGTRSEDCSIKRFHRGAFFLAEQLKVDLLPVVFHGIGHVLPKNELLLRRGEIHVRILPRVSFEDQTYGADFAQRTRKFRQLFIHEYEDMARAIETPAYFAEAIRTAYLYKGREVAAQVRAELERLPEYARRIAAIEPNAHVEIEDCGIGVYALLAVLSRKDITVTATDSSADHIAIASHCTLRSPRLKFMLKE